MVIHPDDNFNIKLLENIENKERYEIVVNEGCIYRCPYRKDHYKAVSGQYHDFLNVDLEAREMEAVRKAGCGHDLKKLLLSPETRTVMMTTNECRHLYDLGFRNFKIQGRSLAPETALLFQLARWVLNDDADTDYKASRLLMGMFDL